MLLKALVVAGLVVLPTACSDDEEGTEEAVEMPADDDQGGMMGAGMDPMPAAGGANSGGTFGSTLPAAPTPGIPANPATQLNPAGQLPLASGGLPAGQQQIEGEGAGKPSLNQGASVAGGAPFYVRSAVLRVRSGPGMQFPTVGYLTFNAEVHALETHQNWVKIGPNKFLSRHYLSTQKNSKQFIPAH